MVAQAGKVTFSTPGMLPHWGQMSAQTAVGDNVASGDVVADGTQVTFTAPKGVGYYVDWYVNDVKDETTTDFSFTLTVSGDMKVEAR